MRFAFLAILVTCAGMLPAQASQLLPGSRVRLESQDFGRRIEGTVMSHQGDSVIVASAGSMRTAVSHSSITRARASTGKSRSAGAVKGAKIGAMLGGGVGLAMALLFASGDYPLLNGDDVVPFTLMYATSGAMWGLGIGAVVGAEKWTTVYSKPQPVGVAVSVRF